MADGMSIQSLKKITDHEAFEGLKIIDVDSHFSEPHDLWTSRAPARMKEMVPRVMEKDGDKMWVVGEDQKVLHRASPTSVVGKDYNKIRGGDFLATNMDQVHQASWDLVERVKILDAFGIHSQVLYPNVGGTGFTLYASDDEDFRRTTVEIYNDVTLEAQAATNGRIMPMTVTPFWSIEAAVKEVERCADLGSHGIVLGGDVHTAGVPHLGEEYWDPLWELCVERDLPINFHIGNSEIAQILYHKAAWPGYGPEKHLAVTSCSLYIDNARAIGNLIYSGVPHRHPKIKFVSVESGLGWLPFYLESLDYQLVETACNETSFMDRAPSEYFKRNFHASFWFESGLGTGIQHVIDAIGDDNIMFETDFPHPTCLYPGPLDFLEKSVVPLPDATRRKLVQDNAAKLYNVDIS